MDSQIIMFQSKPIAYVGTVLLALISIYYLIIWKKNKTTDEKIIKAPEPKGAWPIIGHLLLFRSNDLLYRKLGALADELGPAFTIWLGMHRALVVSNCEIAKECFTTHDRILATRPKLIAAKHMAYGSAVVGFAPYGPYWREVRRIITVEFLSNHRLHLLRHIRISEIEMSIKDLDELCLKKKKGSGEHSPAEIDLYQWFKDMSLNLIIRTIVGKRYYGAAATANEDEESRRWKKANVELTDLLGKFAVADAIPWLEGVDVLGQERAMKKTGKELDAIISRWVEEHRMKKRLNKEGDEQDFIDVILNIIEDDAKIFDYDADSVIKATISSLISGGTDSTTLTLTWAMSLLLNNRHVLEKAQAELERQIGRSKEHVEEEDIKKLPYLQAIVKETWRLYPPTPLSLPHEAMEDCTVAGFHVPKGTRLITNLWKIQRDPKVWEDPLEFRPERFLTGDRSHVDFGGQHFELIPFGAGRRICPGISLASGVIHLTLARLLHEFELETPSSAPVDMTESADISMVKAKPLNVLVARRLR